MTADKRGYSSCSQERISSLAANEEETADKQFGVFDLNTLNPQVLFSINVLLTIQKVGSIYTSTVQEMSPHPSSSFLFSERKKSCGSRALTKKYQDEKDVYSVSDTFGWEEKNANTCNRSPQLLPSFTMVSSDSLPLIKLLETWGTKTIKLGSTLHKDVESIQASTKIVQGSVVGQHS